MISPTNESPDRRLRVRWFDAWHPELDKALATLPEMPTCPHELFRMLMQNPIGARKQTALVTEDGRPVAVVGLRRKHRHWEPVPQDPSPRAVAPAAPGFLVPALRALDRDIWVWGFDDFDPSLFNVDLAVPMQPYRIDLTTDFEEYWKESGHWSVIAPARRRTKRFAYHINAPGAAEWTIRHWAWKWSSAKNNPHENVEDYLLAARYFQERGRFFAFVLTDGDEPVAGHTFFDRGGGELTWMASYREPGYAKLGVGTRLLDIAVQWAAEQGYRVFDLGPDHEYKLGWAPISERPLWLFNVCPARIMLAKRIARAATSVARPVGRIRLPSSAAEPRRPATEVVEGA